MSRNLHLLTQIRSAPDPYREKGWDGILDISEHKLSRRCPCLKCANIHREIPLSPNVWEIPVVDWLGKALTPIEAVNVDSNTRRFRCQLRYAVEFNESSTASNSELNHADTRDSEPLRQDRSLLDTICIVWTRIEVEHAAQLIRANWHTLQDRQNQSAGLHEQPNDAYEDPLWAGQSPHHN